MAEETEKKNVDDLKFERVVSPLLFSQIPRRLFEQIKVLDEKMIDEIYKNATNILMVPVINEQGDVQCSLTKQNTWIAVAHDDSLQIKGFIWAIINSIERCIYIYGCAVDKEYQSENGAALKKGLEYLRTLPFPDEVKANIRMATIKPRAYEKSGWKRSRIVLMELNDEPETTSKDTMPAGDGVGGKAKRKVQ